MILLPLLLNACAGTQVSRTQAELTPPATHPTAIAGTIVGEPGLIIKDSGLQTRLSPEIHLVAPISKTAPELQPNPMEPDLWTVVRNGFALPPLTDSNIQRYEKWYSDRPDQMDQMMIRARLFLPYIA